MTREVLSEPAETAPVRLGEVLDWQALESYLRGAIPGLSGDFAVQQFPNGSANLTYRVSFGSQFLVVRRPPFGAIAPGAHDMEREYRTLSRLHRCYDRAPQALAFCADHTVIGSDFLVSEYRPGVVVWGTIPRSMSSHPVPGRNVGFAVVDALADLHDVDSAACDLDTLGRPDGFLARQVAGWTKRWGLVDTGEDGGLTARLGSLLGESIPETRSTGILHNDFKIDNCQFGEGDPERVVSVFDWDMATLGDSLVDLGTLLNYWPDPSDPPELPSMSVAGLDQVGLPTRAEVIDRYVAKREAAGLRLERRDISWYEAYGCWKTAVILQQLYARFVRGETTDARMRQRGTLVAGQARRGLALLAIEA